MKWAYYIKYKIKAVSILAAILAVILMANFSGTNSISHFDNSMTSMMNDRLKPATYIYGVSNHLYEKKLLQSASGSYTPDELQRRIQKHNQGIASLIKLYDATYLTKQERNEWAAFRSNLQQYNALEAQWLQGGTASPALATLLNDYFHRTIANLDVLSSIQVGEGTNIARSSHSMVSSAMQMSYFEISLLIILSLFTLGILSVSDNAVFRQKQVLN